MDEVYSIMQFQAESKGVELVKSISSNVPQNIKTDPKRFKQILFNLIGNALKFTFSGTVEIRVSYEGPTIFNPNAKLKT